jgi:multidrug efflux pump
MNKITEGAAPARFNLSRWALEHSALTRYLLVVLMLLGAVAYFQLGQDEDPPFAFRIMAMRVFWPGATAQQVAEQVTSKLERTLQEVPYADKIRSYSKPGEALITFQVQEAAPPKDIAQTWYTVRKKIADARGTLPGGVQGPFFNDEFGDVYGSIYALWADGFTHEELKEHVDRIRQQLLKVPHVNKVAIFGAQDEKIYIDISQKRLAQLGLDFNQVLAQLGQQNAVEPTGTVQAPSDLLQVRVTGAFQSVQELEQFAIRSGAAGQSGTSFKLSDIATVRRAYIDPPVVKLRHQGHESIALGISMAKGGDIISLGKNLKVAIDQIKADLPAGMELRQLQNQSTVVASSVNEFVKVLMEAVVVVLLVSFISLGLHFKPLRLDWRPGMVVAITIPLVMSITFITMYYWGVGLHKISLGSLIIALGLLVDDAIISVEMMVRKIEEGWDATRAATFAYEATAMPMLTGTLITAVGFLPIGMAQSTVGEYTFAIFAVTAAALVISWVVSVYFVPYLGTLLLKVKPHGAATGEPHELFDTPFYNRFRSLVRACVRHRWITIGLTTLTLALGIMGMGQVQQQFFPSSSRLEVLVSMWYPEGTSFAANEAVTKRFEARVMKLDGVEHVTTWVGSGAERFALVLDQIFPNTNVSQLVVMAKDLPSRERIRLQLPEILAAEFPEARGRALLLPNGPPVTYPVQFRLEGPDPVQLRVYADQVKTIMRAQAHMQGVNDNWNEAVKSLRLEVDQDKARALGVSSAGIAQAIRIANIGSTVGQYRDGDKLIDIVLRQENGEKTSSNPQGRLNDLTGVYVPTSAGAAVPLSQVVKARFAWEPGVLWREGRDYAVTVQGDVSEGMQGATLSAQIDPLLNPIRQKMQPGYRIQVAGAVEESSKGQGSIAVGAPLMLFIMFTLLMLQLHSFSRAVLVFLTGPMGIAGVAAALLISGRPFGFVALLGVIALSGMIMRNSVILIDQIEQDRANGMPAWDAVVEAAVRRFRPILLTAAAAVLAMIPLTRSVFWGPMATAIMGGLVVATFLTLLALPAMYAAWFRIKPPKSGEGRDELAVLTSLAP